MRPPDVGQSSPSASGAPQTRSHRHAQATDPKEHTGMSLRRFSRTFSSRPRPMHIVMLLVFLIVGFGVTATVRTQAADPLAGLNEDQLVTLLSDLDQRESTLRAERNQLQTQLNDLEQAANAQQAAEDAAQQTLRQAEVSAGTVAVHGPGVVLWVSPGNQEVPVSVFITTMAELRNAGAESISINDVRLNSRSWFASDEGGRIIASGTVLAPPYEWRAIGDPSTLAGALEIRGGAASQFRAYGARVNSQEADNVEINAVTVPFTPQWAEPATQ